MMASYIVVVCLWKEIVHAGFVYQMLRIPRGCNLAFFLDIIMPDNGIVALKIGAYTASAIWTKYDRFGNKTFTSVALFHPQFSSL